MNPGARTSVLECGRRAIQELPTVICGFLSPRNVQKLRGGGQDYAIFDNFLKIPFTQYN